MVTTVKRVRNNILGAKIHHQTLIEIATDRIANEGCVCTKDGLALDYKGGDYYVYLWKHMFGEPFYVGKGKGDRWKNIHRNQTFTAHIEKGDAVIYKVITGLDHESALKYEKYVSWLLSNAGVILANQDICIL